MGEVLVRVSMGRIWVKRVAVGMMKGTRWVVRGCGYDGMGCIGGYSRFWL